MVVLCRLNGAAVNTLRQLCDTILCMGEVIFDYWCSRSMSQLCDTIPSRVIYIYIYVGELLVCDWSAH